MCLISFKIKCQGQGQNIYTFITSPNTSLSQTSHMVTIILPTSQYINHDVISIIIVILTKGVIAKVKDKVV